MVEADVGQPSAIRHPGDNVGTGPANAAALPVAGTDAKTWA